MWVTRKRIWDWLIRPRRPSPIRRRSRFRPWLEQLETRELLSTFLVLNTNDTGPGSLRDAITGANASLDQADIVFQIAPGDLNFIDIDSALPGGDLAQDVFVIRPQSQLPELNNPLARIVLDGGTQTVFGGDTNVFGPEIVLDGTQAGFAHGLQLRNLNEVRGLVIHSFNQHGITISGVDNVVASCFIGIDATGRLDAGNSGDGVLMDGRRNTIGGTTPGSGNVISGNNGNGVMMHLLASDNLIQGNFIGTDSTGSLAVGNTLAGVRLSGSGPTGNTVGGTGAARNVISGNSVGVRLETVDGNSVFGNYIGTNAAGTAALGNSTGVMVSGSDNRIGSGAPGTGNVISGNVQAGIEVLDPFVAPLLPNLIQGNRIGTNFAGAQALANGTGILVSTPTTAGSAIIGTNSDGSEDAGERNVISGNLGNGIHLMGPGSMIAGNFIGTDITGTARLGNGAGVFVQGANTRIGTGLPVARNVISGNLSAGVIVDGSGAGSLVVGNFIGTDFTGTLDLGNATHGVQLQFSAAAIFVGGTAPGAGNVISGNDQNGINITSASNAVIQGNFIGTNVTGTFDLGNALHGIAISTAFNTRIGDAPSGANVIAGNDGDGINVTGAASTGNVIRGNFIGTNTAGIIDLGNTGDGVRIEGTTGNIIGSDVAGQGNVISGNDGRGLVLFLGGFHRVQGNFIGTDRFGTGALQNRGWGLYVAGSADNVIGGAGQGAGNVVSANRVGGIAVFGNGADRNIIEGNKVGTDVTGTAVLGNVLASGILTGDADGFAFGITGFATQTRIGGEAPGAGNIISANNQLGIWIRGPGASGNIVQQNRIGTDVTGRLDFGNRQPGVWIDRAPNNLIGGPSAAARNLISGNNQSGVFVSGPTASGNLIQGNYIGVDATGKLDLGNTGAGVFLIAPGNTVLNNVLSGNDTYGVIIRAPGSDVFVVPGNISDNNIVQGNIIGLDAAGNTAVGNTQGGVIVAHGLSNRIGGTTPEARNVISGNFADGVTVFSDDVDLATIIEGNYIGLDITGQLDRGNAGHGINLWNAPGTTVGGVAAGAGNVISGNAADGIWIHEAGNQVVQGNFIGVDATGASAVGNAGSGIRVETADNLIGGLAAAAANVISANVAEGILLITAAAADNRVQGNLIGTDATGLSRLGNLTDGIRLSGAVQNLIETNVLAGNANGLQLDALASNNTIVGNFIGVDRAGTRELGNVGHGILLTEPSENNVIGTVQQPNIIAFNQGAGVARIGQNAARNPIRGNTLFGNAGLGIDVGGDDAPASDVPELLFVAGGSDTFAVGTLAGDANTTYTFDFYASTLADGSLFGEGQRHVGSFELTTNENGAAAFRTILPRGTNFGEFLTATATSVTGVTSEFSRAVVVEVDRHESNNTIAAATDLGSLAGRLDVAALIAPTGDVDVYQFLVDQPSIVELQTFADREGSLLDTILTLRDQTGGLLAINDDFVGQDSIIRVELEAGTYFVDVTGFQGSVGPYRLAIIDTDFVGPQVLRLTPSTTVSASPGELQLLLDDNDLDPETILASAFELEELNEAGNVVANRTNAIADIAYDATFDRLTLQLGSLLADARYRLTVRDSILNQDGLALDGDRQGGPGGNFVGTFAIDTTAPAGTLQQAGLAGESTDGALYRFAGLVNDGHPARTGEIVSVHLDVDGDGFDDGVTAVALLGTVSTPYSITALRGIPSGQGAVPVHVRFVDQRGNRSTQMVEVDTRIPVVTSVRAVGDAFQIVYNLDVSGADRTTSYALVGGKIAGVQYSAATRTAELTILGGLSDGVYTLTVFSGIAGIQHNHIALDGDGDGTPGGHFITDVVVDRVVPVIQQVRLAADSDSGLQGDGRTNQLRPVFEISFSDVFPSPTSEALVLLDVDGDGFDDGSAAVVLISGETTHATVTATTFIAAEGPVPIRVKVTDAAGNSAETTVDITLDRTGARLLSSSRAEPMRTEAGQATGIRFVLAFDSELDPQAAVQLSAFTLFAAGKERIFYDGDDVNRTSNIASVVYHHAEPSSGTPAYIEVLVTLTTNLSDNDDYELTAFAASLVDLAGNPLVGGDTRLRFHFETLPPVVESLTLASDLEGDSPNKIIVQFRDALGLMNADGLFLEDGDHFLDVTLGSDATPIRTTLQPGLHPGGPRLTDATLAGTDFRTLVLTFDQPLARDEALRPSNYVIVTAGKDGMLRTADDEETVLPFRAVQIAEDERQVTLDLTELAAGNCIVRLDGTGDTDLDEQTVRDLGNYRFERLGPEPETLAIGSLHYNAFADRVILSNFAELRPGSYRLTVSGIVNRTGVSLDSDVHSRAFVVSSDSSPVQAALDADAFSGNHAALQAFSLQTAQDVLTSAKALAEADFAEQLLREVAIGAESATDSSIAAADVINAGIRELIDARLAQLPILPHEFVVVWGNDARFLVTAPSGERQIGYRLDGQRLDTQLPNGIVVGNERQGPLPNLTVAIIPIVSPSFLIAGEDAHDVDGNLLLPNLDFSIELEGLKAVNQVGLVFYGRDGFAGTTTLVDIPGSISRGRLVAPPAITSFDPALFVIDNQVLAEAEAVTNQLNTEGGWLILWVDPTDFVVANARSQRAGAVGKENIRELPGAFFSGNGFAELLIAPNPIAGRYELNLIGLGAAFRGALHLLTQHARRDVPFQGQLPAQAQATAVVDLPAATPPASSPLPTPPPVLAPAPVEIIVTTLQRLTAVPPVASPVEVVIVSTSPTVASTDSRAVVFASLTPDNPRQRSVTVGEATGGSSSSSGPLLRSVTNVVVFVRQWLANIATYLERLIKAIVPAGNTSAAGNPSAHLLAVDTDTSEFRIDISSLGDTIYYSDGGDSKTGGPPRRPTSKPPDFVAIAASSILFVTLANRAYSPRVEVGRSNRQRRANTFRNPAEESNV